MRYIATVYATLQGYGMPRYPEFGIENGALWTLEPNPVDNLIAIGDAKVGHELQRLAINEWFAMAGLESYAEKWWLSTARESENLEVSVAFESERPYYTCSAKHRHERDWHVLGRSRTSKLSAILEACKRRPTR
ncbi:MAG: hypothetical protein KDA89_25080 [Planctomycetaceae bacterium]|nr:hypothetical protein [Planctomycetaceae bacterium]